MNPRIFVGAAVGALVVILILFGFSGSVSDIGKGGFLTPSTEEQIIYPVEIVLHDLTVLEVSEKEATLEVKFKISNPTFKSVIVANR